MFRWHLLLCAFLLTGTHVIAQRRCFPPDVDPSLAPSMSVTCSEVEEYLAELSGGEFVGDVVLPSNIVAYRVARTQYAATNHPDMVQPGIVILAESESDVQAAVIFAKECGYSVSIRSGGHSYMAVSSCNSKESRCLQIDVGRMKNREVVNGNQIIMGPGNTLGEIAPFLDETGQFLPTGECRGVALGGHMQTGGYGVFTRRMGALSSHVAEFRIVLADGSIQEVAHPKAGTSQFNDDLFYAVLGGGSGSWGVITQATFNSVNNDDYFSVYWEVEFKWNTEGAVHMFRHFAKVAEEAKDDTRWSTLWRLQKLFGYEGVIILDASWVAPLNEKEEYNSSFFQSILDECKGCQIVHSVVAAEPLSRSLRDRYIFQLDSEVPSIVNHYEKTLRLTDSFPNPDVMEDISRFIGGLMDARSPGFFFSQFLSLAPSVDETRSLPWKGTTFLVTLDMFFPFDFLRPRYRRLTDEFADLVVSYNGVDHRQFWGAHDEPDRPLDLRMDWPKYYEEYGQFRRLMEIKECVDPNDVFKHRMSVPTLSSFER